MSFGSQPTSAFLWIKCPGSPNLGHMSTILVPGVVIDPTKTTDLVSGGEVVSQNKASILPQEEKKVNALKTYLYYSSNK